MASSKQENRVIPPEPTWTKRALLSPELIYGRRPSAVPTGVRLHLHFRAKSSAPCQVTVELMESSYPFPQWLSEMVDLNQHWSDHDFDLVAREQDTEPLMLHMKALAKNVSVDLSHLRLKQNSLQRQDIESNGISQPAMSRNIERFRKGDMTVFVTNQSGQPLDKATVEINQLTSTFLFGTQVQGLNPADTSEQQQNYQRALLKTFNFASVTPYWFQVEKQAGKRLYQPFDDQIQWLDTHHFQIKAHPAFWPHLVPAHLPSDPDQAGAIVEADVRNFCDHFASLPVQFLENNEVAAAVSDPDSNGALSWVQKLGPLKALERVQKIERQALAGHDKKLILNDYRNWQALGQVLDELKRRDQMPDGIGVQMHMTQGEWPLLKVAQAVNQLGRFGLPIYVTEISVISGSHRIGSHSCSTQNWVSTAFGEARQAAYVEKLYTLLFSNPLVHGITWWDLSDKNAWQGAPRGLLRQDMTSKPALLRLQNLIGKQWRSHVSRLTDKNGVCQQRVFFGDYRIRVTSGKSTVEQVVHFDGQAGQTGKIKIVVPGTST